jgi:hypothetical protein
MIAQDGLDFDIQLIETKSTMLHDETRPNSQIAFISEKPLEDIEKVRRWAEGKNIMFTQNAWSDKEFYFDLPELFVDWVVEVMDVSILED